MKLKRLSTKRDQNVCSDVNAFTALKRQLWQLQDSIEKNLRNLNQSFHFKNFPALTANRVVSQVHSDVFSPPAKANSHVKWIPFSSTPPSDTKKQYKMSFLNVNSSCSAGFPTR